MTVPGSWWVGVGAGVAGCLAMTYGAGADATSWTIAAWPWTPLLALVAVALGAVAVTNGRPYLAAAVWILPAIPFFGQMTVPDDALGRVSLAVGAAGILMAAQAGHAAAARPAASGRTARTLITTIPVLALVLIGALTAVRTAASMLGPRFAASLEADVVATGGLWLLPILLALWLLTWLPLPGRRNPGQQTRFLSTPKSNSESETV